MTMNIVLFNINIYKKGLQSELDYIIVMMLYYMKAGLVVAFTGFSSTGIYLW